MSAPAVTRAVSALEDRLGARLLHRTTRVVRLTDAGKRFLEDARRILEAVAHAEAIASSHAEPRGELKVTASVLFGRRFVAPILLDFLARNPRVTARALFDDRRVDLVHEGIDVAIRIGHLADSSLRSIRVGSMRRVVCASPDYLARHGVPEKPSDLAAHSAVGFSGFAGMSPQGEWTFGDDGLAESVAPPMRFVANTADVAIAAAVAGHGVTRVMSYMVERELEEGRLVAVLREFEPALVPIQIVHLGGRHAPARVRAFVDFAAEALRAKYARE